MEEEIDLIDYIKVIIKRWKLILAIFLVAIFVSTGVSFILPKTYQTQAVVKIGKVEGAVLENIIETIEILKENYPGVTLSNPSGTNLLRIKAQGETSQQTLNKANDTIDFLLTQYQEIYEKAKLLLEEEIINIQKDVTNIEQKLEGVETKIKEVDLDIQKQEAEIKGIEEKIKKEEATENQARALVIQGYLLRFTAEKNRKESFENKKETLAAEKQQLIEDERKLEDELKTKQPLEESNFEPSRVEISPVLPQNPIKPNIKLNLLVAAVLGIFIGVLVAFGKEWWEKETNHI